VMAAVRQSFKPEFVNRLDDVLVFEQLGLHELTRIVEVQLDRLATRLADRRLALKVSEDAKRWLAARGFDPVYGARPLRRLVQTAVGDQLAKALLSGTILEGDEVLVDVAEGGDALSVGAGAHLG
jgi:ATP-dependent Clp protease ATP-binding subunit ClpB